MARRHADKTDFIQAEWWDTDEQVEIHSCISRGMKKQIEASMVAFIDTSAIDPQNPMETMKIDMEKAIATGDEKKFEVCIVSWTLKDSKGQVLPFPAGLDDLVDEDIKFISDEIEKRDKATTPEQRDSLLDKQSGGTSEESTAPTTRLLGG